MCCVFRIFARMVGELCTEIQANVRAALKQMLPCDRIPINFEGDRSPPKFWRWPLTKKNAENNGVSALPSPNVHFGGYQFAFWRLKSSWGCFIEKAGLVSHYSAIGDTISCDAPCGATGHFYGEGGGVAAIVCDTTGNAVRPGVLLHLSRYRGGYCGRVTKKGGSPRKGGTSGFPHNCSCVRCLSSGTKNADKKKETFQNSFAKWRVL